MEQITIGISGLPGRMGRRVLEVLDQEEDVTLEAAITSPGSPHLNLEINNILDTESTRLLKDRLERSCDAVIDFSTPEGTRRRIQECRGTGSGLVVGTTGLSEDLYDRLRDASRDIPIVVSSNMSPGMNLLFEEAPRIAEALGEEYDIEIIEHHHNQKEDAPSGTALTLGKEIAEHTEKSSNHFKHGRKGNTGPRDSEEIGFHAVRGGGEKGTHRVLLCGESDTIELRHQALNRNTFARGALRAARFVAGRDAGLFDMRDVLGMTGEK